MFFNNFYNNKIIRTVLILSFCLTSPAYTYAYVDYSSSFEFDDSKRISMDFKNASLNDVLKIFSQQSGLNFVASTNVSGTTLNLYLDNVPVEAALERILSANNLTYEISPGSNIFIVKELKKSSTETLSRVYQLKHASVPTSKIHATLSASAEAAEEDSTEATAEAGLVAAVQAVLSSEGSVIEDPRTNSLIITDIPSQFIIIEQTIARLDVRIPQILIEVEMLDISKSTSDKLGVKWGDTPIEFTGGERQDFLPFLSNDELLEAEILTKDERYTNSVTSFAGLQMILQFLRSQTDTRNLARPRILTLNNETAEIEIKTDEAIGIENTSTSSEGLGSSVEQAEREETGVFLKVTPQANLNTGEITMAVEPKVIQARLGQTFGETQFKDPEERKTKSMLRVRDGDTIILGGLLRIDDNKASTKVPVLSKVPVFGGAFRHKDETSSERELIVFITPHIIKDDYPTTQLSANYEDQFLREQNIPKERLKNIDKELSYLENRKF